MESLSLFSTRPPSTPGGGVLGAKKSTESVPRLTWKSVFIVSTSFEVQVDSQCHLDKNHARWLSLAVLICSTNAAASAQPAGRIVFHTFLEPSEASKPGLPRPASRGNRPAGLQTKRLAQEQQAY